MPQPTRSDLHIDRLLSDLSISFLNAPSAYIADRVFPVVLSPKQSNKYAIYEKTGWFRDEAAKRAILTESMGGGYDMETPGNFFCDEYSFHKDIADEDKINADEVFELELEATEFCVEKLRLSREVRWATTYFGTGIWTSEYQGKTVAPGSDEFLAWNYEGSTPIQDIETGKLEIKALTGLNANTLVVSERVHGILKNHANVIDRFKYTQRGIITDELLAAVFEVDNYLVAKAIKATSEERATTDTMSHILNENDALLVYSAPRPARRRPSGGYTFRWNRAQFGGVDGPQLQSTIRRFRLDKVKGDRVEGSIYEDIKLVSVDCGLFFDDAYL